MQRGAVDTAEAAAPSWSWHRRQQLSQRSEGARPPRLGKLCPRRSRSAGPVSGVWCPSGRRARPSTCTLPQRSSLLRVCPALAFRSADPGFPSQALSVHLRFSCWWGSGTRLFVVEGGSSVRAVAPAFGALTADIVACAQSTGRWLRCCCQGNFWMHSGTDMFRLAVLMSDPLIMLSALRVAVWEKSASSLFSYFGRC